MIKLVVEELEKQFVGQREILNLMLTALLCGGHVLIEDVPGVGKTTLARSMASVFNCSFGRIQCTSDLLPADILGYSWFDRIKGEMIFKKGPIHHQIILADEINRATPKTQSSLLEAMEENQVTIDGVTYPMAYPFWVIATQNPVEFEGTFPLPEAQLDRFFLRVSIGYPSDIAEELKVVYHRRGGSYPMPQAIINTSTLKALQNQADQVSVSPELEKYIAEIVRATRTHSSVSLGVSPRGTIALYRAAKGWAHIAAREWVQPEDIRKLVLPVLGHRILITPEARYRGETIGKILMDIINQVPIPLVDPHEYKR